jgi:putative FmdB family regulatory protein
MPTYLYECEKCGSETQVRAKMNDPKPTECPKCLEKNTLSKKIGGGQFKLSGGGWFSDGYMGGGGSRGGSNE